MEHRAKVTIAIEMYNGDSGSRKPIIALRPYQEAGLSDLWHYWQSGGGNPLIEMATGTGKSLVIGEIIRRLMIGASRRVLVLVHVKELIEQNLKALLSVWPDAPVGIWSAGLGERNIDAPIVIGGIQSVFRNPDALGRRNLVIVDEAHLIPRSGDGMYLSTIAALRQLYSAMRVCGLTATPYRLDSGRLDEGDDRLFDRIVFSYGIGRAIDEGWLSPLIAKATRSEIDVRSVHRRGGEFISGELEAAANLEEVVSAAVDEIVERGKDRRSWLCFCVGVDHAAHVRDVLRERGIETETVTGETPAKDRESIFAEFRAGGIRALTGVNVFTTGFDAPAVDLIAMLRPTLSTGLYVQMLGRGTRKADDKVNCEVLDFAGNVRRHGPVDAPTINRAKARDEEQEDAVVDVPDVKVCPECSTYVISTAPMCQHCGYQWSVRRFPLHEGRADNFAILSRDLTWLSVDSWTLRRHEKVGSKATLRIEYHSDDRTYYEWLAVEHDGVAHEIATKKWLRLGGALPAPVTVIEALSRRNELCRDVEIAVRHDGQYWRVVTQRMRQPEAVPA